MYPSLPYQGPGAEAASRPLYPYPGGDQQLLPPHAAASLPPSGRNIAQLSRQNSTGNDWATDLRVVIAEDFRVDPPIQVPPALEAVARPHQAVDFEYERQVMVDEASACLDSFLAKPEESHFKESTAGKFISMGFSVSAVSLALAYQAATRGSESKVVDFCNNYSQLLGMGFRPALAAGALVNTGNDVTAAAELCLSAAS